MEPVITRNILERLPVGLLVIDPLGEIILVNASASAILGYPLEAIYGKGWADLFMGSADNDLFNQVIVDVIWKESVNLHRAVPYTRPTGEVVQLSIISSLVRGEREPVGIVVLLNDVTEIHKLHVLEKRILVEKHQLQQERTESLNKLAMAVAHQVRNPTMVIGGFASIMLKNLEPDALPVAYLQNIVSSTMRLEEVVRSVHDYASIVSVSVKSFTLNSLYEQLQHRVKHKAEELSIEATLIVPHEVIEIEGDPKLLAEALDEILDNSVEAMTSAKGIIELSAKKEENVLLLSIQDNGAGISGEDLPYVFDPFFTTKAVGVGMGLCRARRIIAEHEGDLWLESISGVGTKALIKLPHPLFSSPVTKGEYVMEIVDEVIGKGMVLKLNGRLDSTSATDLKEKVKDCVRGGQNHLVIDMAEVDFVDSSGLGSLVACLHSVNRLGGTIRIAALQDRVRAVFELIRLHRVFEVFDTVHTAADDLRNAGENP